MALKDFGINVINLFKPAGKLERPPIDLNDEGWYSGTSGELDRKTALKFSAVYKAVNLISTSVGKLPLFVFERVDGGKEKFPESPAYNLLRYKPNIEITAKIFKQTIVAHALLQGNGYAYIFRDNAGRPVELINMAPDVTFPLRHNGELFYVTSVNDKQVKLLAENVLHIRGLGYTSTSGYSLLELAADAMTMGLNSQKYTNKFYENGARPSVILEHPSLFNDEAAIDRLKKSWNSLHQGIENAWKTAVLEQGMKANFMNVNAKDAQLIETLEFSLIDIANFFSIPPHKLGDKSRTAYNSIEAENQSFLDDGLDSWLVTYEEECRDKLLTERQKDEDSHLVEFSRQALVRADLKTRAEYYKSATGGAPWLTVNEARSLENLNSKGEEYNEIILPVNLFGEEEEEEETNSDDSRSDTKPHVEIDESEAIKQAREALEHVRGKMLTRIRKDFDKHVKRNETELFTENFEEKHGSIIRREIEPVAKIIEILTGEEDIINRTIEQLMREVKG